MIRLICRAEQGRAEIEGESCAVVFRFGSISRATKFKFVLLVLRRATNDDDDGGGRWLLVGAYSVILIDVIRQNADVRRGKFKQNGGAFDK